MNFATSKGERKLSDLVQRLYPVQGKAALGRQAEDALLRANPHLADLSKVPAGSLILVPPVPGLAAAAEPPPVEGAVRDAVDAVRKALDGVKAALDESAATADADLKQTLDLLADADLKKAVGQKPAAGVRLAAIGEEAKRQAQEAKATADANRRALDALQKGLSDLSRRFAK
jgi:hypothetical protein